MPIGQNSRRGFRLFLLSLATGIFFSGLLVVLSPAAHSETGPAVPLSSIQSDSITTGTVPDSNVILDPGLSLYRFEKTHDSVLAFFSESCGSEVIARAIADNADRFGVPLSLAFALAWEESRFTSNAINRNADSVDRGLFQLNSKSFPELNPDEFFDPFTSARYGLSHLSYCLDSGGNEIAALAMYNAGQGRVSTGGTPRRTLDYISRIQAKKAAYDQKLIDKFGSALAELMGAARRIASTR